jgi:REP element-mobilizing transposase RayT
MARALRLEYEGAIYHVIARGNYRQLIYRDDDDRRRFLEKLEQSVEQHHLRLYAYVLMSNHFHLLVCTPRGNLSQAMQQFQTSYSSYFRARHRLSGHVYGGRYKAPLVQGDRYLLALTRYIQLNPVRIRRWKTAPLMDRRQALRAYRWSSYRSYIGKSKPPDWLEQQPLLNLAGRGRKGYRDYVERGLVESDDELEEAMGRSSKAIGNTGFCDWVEGLYANLAEQQGATEDVAMRRMEVSRGEDEVLDAVCAYFEIPARELLSRRGNGFERDVLMLAWRDQSGLSNRAVGHRLGQADGATVGKRFKAILSDQGTKKRVAEAVRELAIDNCKA